MKACVFIPGLGEAFEGTSSRNYAKHLAQEMDNQNDVALKYSIKEEKFEYLENFTTHCISIFSDNKGVQKLEYRFYDFSYRDILTKEFKSKNVFIKCILLFLTVFTKLSIAIKRIFIPNALGYQSARLRLSSFYTFIIFLVISLVGISLIPGVLTLLGEFVKDNKTVEIYLAEHERLKGILLGIQKILLSTVAFSILVFSLLPSSKDVLTGLATEFSSVHYYLQLGQGKQAILGRLDNLIQFIAERESVNLQPKEELSLHIHAYSFGSIIALDHLFPLGKQPARHTENFVKCVVTIGCPYEFIESYYQSYFKDRSTIMGDKLKWYNVLSLIDALSSNFRNDAEPTPATYSVTSGVPAPYNLQYEITRANPSNIINFLTLYALRAHQFYWDKDSVGNSCVGNIYLQLKKDNFIS